MRLYRVKTNHNSNYPDSFGKNVGCFHKSLARWDGSMVNTKIIAAGTVIDFLSDACFRGEDDNGAQISAHASVKLRNRAYYISTGNRVTIHCRHST
jgi:translation initiation factor IF-1